MKKHQKHTKLPLRNFGFFAPNEIAILGSSCSVISTLVNDISVHLNPYKIAYVDASHDENKASSILNQYTFNQNKTLTVQKHVLNNSFQQLQEFSSFDLTFINGNHYQGNKQIVILDHQKEASLLKRIDQLTDILCFIKTTKETKIFEFLSEKIPTIDLIPIYEIDEIDKLSELISAHLQQNIPVLKGLVLVGGKSERMGTDKSSLAYFGINQREHLFNLLQKNVSGDVYISSRKEQDFNHQNLIPDTFLGLGPYGGICSAFMQHPNNAFLVVAADLPFVDDELLQLLISKRNPTKIATTFIGKNNPFPEPLITIWEPKSYPILLQYLSMGYSCPRKVLINSDVELITINEDLLRNINTPDEYEQVKKELKNK
ncbi:MAG: NTP transferase domain-containing protein [Flavobacteriaceae bacterium]|nr:NTP transferase domain-containing protein [Flavobacteriaceae bacterium]